MVAAAAAAAAGGQRGAVMSSLAAGEGPLSKSHSMLTTKPGAPQEQIMGKSLEIVAEDEREGRGAPCMLAVGLTFMFPCDTHVSAHSSQRSICSTQGSKHGASAAHCMTLLSCTSWCQPATWRLCAVLQTRQHLPSQLQAARCPAWARCRAWPLSVCHVVP
jgi:hypothetical protein